jgi:hypothetical protein
MDDLSVCGLNILVGEGARLTCGGTLEVTWDAFVDLRVMAIAPGQYAASPRRIVNETEAVLNASGAGEPESGIVIIESATADRVIGTFDIVTSTGHLTGRFDAPVCPTADPRDSACRSSR